MERVKARVEYERNQLERQKKWEQDMIAQGKVILITIYYWCFWDVILIKYIHINIQDPVEERKKFGGCSHGMNMFNGHHNHNHSNTDSHEHKHNHTHDHNHSHNNNDTHDDRHKHGNENHEHNHDNIKKVKSSFPRKPQCGFMTPEQIKQMQAQQKLKNVKPKLTPKELNDKKKKAVYAAKADGNKLFKENKLDLAFKVYERGILIINGMHNMSDTEYDEMDKIEEILNLNIALIKLKENDYTEAISCIKMALQLNKSNPKAYFRYAEALIGLSEYNDALIQSNKALNLCKNSKLKIECQKQLIRIQKMQQKYIKNSKINDQKFSKAFQKKKVEL